jgi:hypothetical protein
LVENDFSLHLREHDDGIICLHTDRHQKVKNRIETKSCEPREPLNENSITWGSR